MSLTTVIESSEMTIDSWLELLISTPMVVWFTDMQKLSDGATF